VRSLGFLAFLAAPATAAVGDEDVGLCVHHGEQAFIDAAADLGVTWVRVDGNWDAFEPSDDNYQWGGVDAAVDAANAAGISVFLTLAYTPSWVARHGDTDGYPGNDVPNGTAEWTDFVGDAVVHFRARGVRHFGIWNEPNLRGFFEGTVDEYANVIANPGATAVRAACADCLVLGPELAHVGAADDYLEAVLQRTPSAWDIITHHNYHAFAETGWQIFDGDSFINALDMQRFPFTRRSLRQILDGAGWTGEVWIAETGYRASPGDANEEMLQAIYVERALEEQLARAWYTNSFFYEIHDCGPDQPSCTIDGFGLMRATGGTPGNRSFPNDFRTKPAYDALKRFIIDNPSIVGGSPPLQCGDGADNDGDQRIDLADRGCADPLDDDESNDPPRTRLDAEERAITVDGDLTDFGASFISLGEPEWRGTEALAGPGDLSVRAAARWTSGQLFLAFEVIDDVHANDHVPAELWQGDSVQVAFDVAQSGGQAYDMIDDHEINFAIVQGTPSSFRFVGPNGAQDGWSFAGARSGSVTRYEIGLPSGVLPGVVFTEGALIGFSFLVNEDDGAGRIGWIEWTPGIGQSKVPELFGEIRLGSATATPDAGVGDTGGGRDGSAEDAVVGMDASPSDAGATMDAAPSADGGTDKDAGTAPPDAGERPSSGGGCGCTTHARQGSPLLFLFVLAWARGLRGLPVRDPRNPVRLDRE
jgi:hypothetical protein